MMLVRWTKLGRIIYIFFMFPKGFQILVACLLLVLKLSLVLRLNFGHWIVICRAPEDGEQVTKSLQHKGGQQGGKLRETKSVTCYIYGEEEGEEPVF